MMGSAPVVLIDGRAGSGKTSLATRVREMLFPLGYDAEIIHMDDLTPGWHGLSSARAAVAAMLTQRARLGTGTWQRYDWHRESLAEDVSVSRSTPLIIEGCGALSSASVHHASASIWLNCDERLRRERALARDGVMFEQFWEVWAAHEQEHIDVERPHLLADIVCDTDGRDTLDECSRLLSSFLDQEATSEHS